jgi:hypothetical protein
LKDIPSSHEIIETSPFEDVGNKTIMKATVLYKNIEYFDGMVSTNSAYSSIIPSNTSSGLLKHILE